MPNENPFGDEEQIDELLEVLGNTSNLPDSIVDEDKIFDSVDEFLDRLQEDLSEKGFEVEFGERYEDNVELLNSEGEAFEGLRVPTNLEMVNKQMGPISGYDMTVQVIVSALSYDNRGGDVPFLEI